MRPAALVAVAVLTLALRAWPLHVYYIHPDQEFVPDMAMAAVEGEHWRPWNLAYPSGQFAVLRVAYSVGYGVAHATGAQGDRLDYFAAYVERPFPFLLVARAWSCLTGVLTVVATALLAAHVFGPACGATAGVLLALAFGHVRESHWGSVDVPATCFLVATLLATDHYRRSGRGRDLIAAGVLVGCAAGFRYQLAVVALAPALAVAIRRPLRQRDAGWLALAALASAVTFCVLSPYTLIDQARFAFDVALQTRRTYYQASSTLDLWTLLSAGNGLVPCLLALLGAAMACRRAPRASVPLLAVALALLAMVVGATRIYLRYVLPLAPFIALFAAVGLQALAARLPVRWRGVGLVALAAIAVADPAWRSLELDALLARTDTRVAAGRWMAANLPAGSLVLLPVGFAYGNPELRPRPTEAFFQPMERARRLMARGHLRSRFRYLPYGRDGAQLAAVWQPGAYAVTLDHPVTEFLGQVPPQVAARLEREAELVAHFPGHDPAAARQALFEPIDASAFPLRGLQAIDAPGPNIAIYRLPAPSLASPAPAGEAAGLDTRPARER